MIQALVLWWRQSLTTKITAVTLVFLVMVTGVSTWLLTSSERRVIRRQMDAQGQSLLRAASIGCIEPLLVEDYPVLDTLTQTLVHDQTNVVFAVIRRRDGKVVSRCPAQFVGDRLPAHQVYSGPIVANSADRAMLGTISIGLATNISDRFVATRISAIAMGALLCLVQLALVLVWTLRVVVGKPLQLLDQQAARLGRGDLNAPILVQSSDELGRLALTLDQMRRNLQTSYEELQDQNRRLKQLDRMKDEFLANMSHEIRTPLAAVLGFADVLMEMVHDDESLQAVETIKRNGDHLLQIINDILDLSKIQAGKLRISSEACSPHELVAEVASLMRVRANAKGLSLDVTFAGRLPQRIISDSTRLRQILLNLVGNAIKFTEQGRVHIETRLVQSDQGDSRLRFNIVDSGVGMTDEQMARLFQPFYQVDSSMTRTHGGTGLGLAICKHLSQMLGGEIFVKSAPGEGSTFSLVIPAGDVENVPMIDDATEADFGGRSSSLPDPQWHRQSPGQAAGARVLLAEDGPDNQRLITHLLTKAGCSVAVADNGRVALKLALDAYRKGQPFDLVLMDIQMPEMDGYTATRMLRQSGYPGPIIAVTAHAMSGETDRSRQAGCDGYLAKPINPKLFFDMISHYLRAQQAHLAETR